MSKVIDQIKDASFLAGTLVMTHKVIEIVGEDLEKVEKERNRKRKSKYYRLTASYLGVVEYECVGCKVKIMALLAFLSSLSEVFENVSTNQITERERKKAKQDGVFSV